VGVTIEHLLKLRQDVDQQLAAAEKESKSLRGELTKLQKKLDDTRKPAKKLGDATDSIGDKAGDLDTVLQGLSGVLGIFSPQLEGAARAGGDMAAGVEAASKATTLLGSPIGAAIAGAAVLTATFVGTATAAIGVVVAADSMVDSLMPLQGIAGIQILPPGQLEAVRQTAAAVDALALIGKEIATIFAGELAPGTRDVTVALVATALAFRDFMRDLSEGQGVLRTVAEILGTAWVRALTLPLNMLATLIGTWGDLIDAITSTSMGRQIGYALGLTGDDFADIDAFAGKLRGVKESYLDLTASLAGQGVGALFEGISDGIASFTDRNRDYISQAQSLVASFVRIRAEAKGLGETETSGGGRDYRGQLSEHRLAAIQGSDPGIGGLYGNIAIGAARSGVRNVARGLPGGYAGAAAGDPSALLGALGPLGATLGGVAKVGALGASGVRDNLEGFIKAVRAGLEALPEILSEVLPDFVVDLVGNLIPELIKAAPKIFVSLIEGILSGIREIFKAPFERLAELLGFGSGAVDASSGGVYATSGSNPYGTSGADAFATSGNAFATSARTAAGTAPGFSYPTPVRSGGRAPVQINITADIVDSDAVGRFTDKVAVELGLNGSRAGTSLAGGY